MQYIVEVELLIEANSEEQVKQELDKSLIREGEIIEECFLIDRVEIYENQ